MRVVLAVALALGLALSTATGSAQSPGADSGASQPPSPAPGAICPTVVADIETLVARLTSDASEPQARYAVAAMAGDPSTQTEARSQVAALLTGFAASLGALVLPAEWKAASASVLAAASTESDALQNDDGDIGLPATQAAIQSLRDIYRSLPECESALNPEPTPDASLTPEVDVVAEEVAVRDVLCGVLVPGSDMRGSAYAKAYRSIPRTSLDRVRTEIQRFFRRHGQAVTGFESLVSPLSDDEGYPIRWFDGRVSSKAVNRLVARMGKAPDQAQLPTEEVVKMFATVAANFDDQQIRKDAVRVATAAYRFGSKSLESGGEGFWPYITSNINSAIRVEHGLTDCTGFEPFRPLRVEPTPSPTSPTPSPGG